MIIYFSIRAKILQYFKAVLSLCPVRGIIREAISKRFKTKPECGLQNARQNVTIIKNTGTNMEKVRCAIIGVGTMGKKYALMISGGQVKGLSLAAVCCRGESSARWAAENLKGAVICRNEAELYGHSQLFDAVLVVTPHKSHPAIAVRAFEEGKHIMCDKPAGVTVSDAQAIDCAARASGKVYAMMCHQRTYPHYIKIKQLLSGGEIGQIKRINLENSGFFRTKFYHRSANWRSSWTGEGGGALINQGYHLLDMWRFLFGMPLSVYADIPFGKYNDFAVDDEATLLMDYPGKTTGTFIISTGEGCPTERLEIVGTRGKILLDGYRLTVTKTDCDVCEYAAAAQVNSSEGLKYSAEEFTFAPPENAYITMLENFANAVMYGEKPIADGFDGADTLSLINAAYLSAWQGKKITLPVDMGEYIALLHERESAEKHN